MSLPASVPVKVNFNVVIDADSKVQLFGEVAPAPTNVIVAEHTLPVTALYDADAGKGLLEIWEPADAQGDIKCQLANSDTSASGGPVLTGAYQTAAKKLAAGLQAILCDRFDCSGAAPYTNYTTNVEYFKQRDFGRVALGMMAHYLFGHVDATAAITNDKAFVESMLSVSAGGDDETADGPAARVAAFIKSITANVEGWSYAASAADANLALRLVKAIVEKGKAGADVTSATLVQSAVSAVTDSSTDQTLANIVKQVIGQDSSRVQNVDGSQRTRDQHLLLRFYPGDVIYMNIKVKRPTVEVTGVAGGANAPANSLVTEQSYALKIKLSSGIPTADPAKIIYQAGSNNTVITGYTGNAVGELTIPEGVTRIGQDAFYNQTGLTKVYFPSTLTRLDSYSFHRAGLTTLTLGPGITVGDGVFYNNAELVTADLSAMTITSIPYAFINSCQKLVTLKLPVGLTSIDRASAAHLTSLTTLLNTENVTYVGDEALLNSSSLLTTINFPALTAVGISAFQSSRGFTTFDMPSLTNIGGSAFYDCSNLTSVKLSANLTTLNANAFAGCPKLNALYFRGNAPTFVGGSLPTTITLYYKPGAAGWDAVSLANPKATW